MEGMLVRSRYAHLLKLNGSYYIVGNISGGIAELDDAAKRDYICTNTKLSLSSLKNDSPFDSEEQDFLLNASIYVDESSDEDAAFAGRIEEFRGKDELNVILALTEDCNFKCPYCYERHVNNYMTLDEVDSVIRFVRGMAEKHDTSVMRIAYFGGEPLLNKAALRYAHKRIEEEFPSMIKDYLLITNGYLLDKETVDFLAESGSYLSVQVTVDGPPAIHDERRPLRGGGPSFERIISNIVYASEKLPVVIRMNFDKDSIGYADELLEIIEAAGVNKARAVISANMAISNTQFNNDYKTKCLENGLETLNALSRVSKHALKRGFKLDSKSAHYERPGGYGGFPFGAPKFLFCAAYTGKHLVFMPGGDIFSCMERVSDKRFAVGNINASPAFNANDGKWKGFSIAKFDKCRACPVSCLCGGGCGSESIGAHGDLSEPVCFMSRSLVEDGCVVF